MEEKMLKEMISLLSEIKEKLTVQPGVSTLRGPVGDPGPDFGHGQYHGHIPWPYRPWIDPAPEFFLKKEDLAKINVMELDHTINQINGQLDVLKLKRDLIKAEYKIK